MFNEEKQCNCQQIFGCCDACDANPHCWLGQKMEPTKSQTWKPLWLFLILRIATKITGKLHI